MDNINVEGMLRFEEMCRLYLDGTEKQREIILGFLTDDEKQIFLEGVGLFHLLTDEMFYKNACRAVGEQIYSEVHA